MSKPGFYDPGDERGGSQNDQTPPGPSMNLPCQGGTRFQQDWPGRETETPRAAGAQGPGVQAVEVNAQICPLPLPPAATLPWGQNVQTGNPQIWPTDVFCLANAVFVKNVIELPTFKNRMISY